MKNLPEPCGTSCTRCLNWSTALRPRHIESLHDSPRPPIAPPPTLHVSSNIEHAGSRGRPARCAGGHEDDRTSPARPRHHHPGGARGSGVRGVPVSAPPKRRGSANPGRVPARRGALVRAQCGTKACTLYETRHRGTPVLSGPRDRLLHSTVDRPSRALGRAHGATPPVL